MTDEFVPLDESEKERLTGALTEVDALVRALRVIRDHGYRRKQDIEDLITLTQRTDAAVAGALFAVLRSWTRSR